MDFTKAGILDGIKKAGVVALYVAISGALAALGAELKKYEVTNQDVTIGLIIMVINSIIAGAQKWVTTKSEIKK